MTPLLSLLLLLTALVTGPARGQDNAHYLLNSGDRIRILVHNEPDLTVETHVSNTGTIHFPFLGDIQARGRTPAQLQTQIADGLRGEYLVDPKVSVSVAEYRPFFVNGEVRNPGGFAYQPGLTVHKAIALAGGLTERASSNKIYIIPEHSPDNRRQATMNTQVGPGDIITIEQSFF